MRPRLLALLVFLLPSLAHADNSPAAEQRAVEERVLPKIQAACGFPLALHYDEASLKRHDVEIARDQTDGGQQCNEPLRYIWYACKTEAGRAALKRAGVKQVRCVGGPEPVGELSYGQGTIVVRRAFHEEAPHLRSRRQFEQLFGVRMPWTPPARQNHAKAPLADPLGDRDGDPYYDEAWSALRHQPNPVTDVRTSCDVDGQRVLFDAHAQDPFERRKEDARVRCWKDGALVTDLTITQGRSTGFYHEDQGDGFTRRAVRDGQAHGEERVYAKGRLIRVSLYEGGREVWHKELHPDGSVARYRLTHPLGMLSLERGPDGKLYGLACGPAAKGDAELDRPCGFAGEVTHAVYDGTQKVNRIETYKDGLLERVRPGDSTYARRVEATYRGGKLHGDERRFDKDGKLEQVTVWDQGARTGVERFFAQGGQKLVKEVEWQADVMKRLKELYFNGRPKLEEVYEGEAKKLRRAFHDNGQLREEGTWALVETARWGGRQRDWQRQGTHRRFFQDGKLEAEEPYLGGQLHGTRKLFWESGKPAAVEAWDKGVLTQAKRWDRDGVLKVDEAYEADGSRKR